MTQNAPCCRLGARNGSRVVAGSTAIVALLLTLFAESRSRPARADDFAAAGPRPGHHRRRVARGPRDRKRRCHQRAGHDRFRHGMVESRAALLARTEPPGQRPRERATAQPERERASGWRVHDRVSSHAGTRLRRRACVRARWSGRRFSGLRAAGSGHADRTRPLHACARRESSDARRARSSGRFERLVCRYRRHRARPGAPRGTGRGRGPASRGTDDDRRRRECRDLGTCAGARCQAVSLLAPESRRAAVLDRHGRDGARLPWKKYGDGAFQMGREQRSERQGHRLSGHLELLRSLYVWRADAVPCLYRRRLSCRYDGTTGHRAAVDPLRTRCRPRTRQE